MTEDEAKRIAAVIATADGGCAQCVRDLCELMTEAGLGFSFTPVRENIIESLGEFTGYDDILVAAK